MACQDHIACPVCGALIWVCGNIIKELVDEFGTVLWLDSGNSVGKHSNLTEVAKALSHTGFHSPASVGSVQEWTHPLMLKYLGISIEQTKPWNNCNGAIVGFSKHSPAYEAVLVPWVACALERACIAPPTSNRTNHRQDQAALTVVAQRAGYTCGPYCKTGCDGVALHQDGRAAVINACQALGVRVPAKQNRKNQRRRAQQRP